MSDIKETIAPEAATEIVAEDKVVTEAVVDTPIEADTSIAEAPSEETKSETILEESPKVEEVATESTWMDSLPSELKESSFVEKFKDKTLEEVIKSAISAEKLIGKKVEDFEQGDFDKYLTKQNIPTDATDYKLTEGLENTEEFTKVFHDAKLTQDQAKLLSDYVVEQNMAESARLQEQSVKLMEETKHELKREFGEAYDKRITLAKSAIKELGGDELLTTINDSGLGANAGFIKMMSNVGKEIGEHRIIKGEHTSSFGLTPEDARRLIGEKKKDSTFMSRYMANGEYNRASKEHKSAVSEMEQLFKLAYTE